MPKRSPNFKGGFYIRSLNLQMDFSVGPFSYLHIIKAFIHSSNPTTLDVRILLANDTLPLVLPLVIVQR